MSGEILNFNPRRRQSIGHLPKISNAEVLIFQERVQQLFKNDPTKKLRQSNHPRAKALLEWLESNEKNKKWYMESIGTKFDLVQDGIFLLGNIWELEDVKMEENPEKGIWNNDGYTYFSFETQSDLFGDNVPKKDDWIKLIDFLPGNDRNRVDFLTKVLGLNFTGHRDFHTGIFTDMGTFADYWSSTSISSTGNYSMGFSFKSIDVNVFNIYDQGYCVRCLIRA